MSPTHKRVSSETDSSDQKRRPEPKTDKLPCKFYATGFCRFGDNCQFSHDKLSTGKLPVSCRFFATKGFCADGDKCRFLHIAKETNDSPAPAPADVAKTVVCKFHMSFRGCKAGDACPFLHPPREVDIPSFVEDIEPTGKGKELLDRYSMAKTADSHGQDAIIRKHQHH